MFLHYSAKKVQCAKHQWIHLVGDQPESPQAFQNFVVNAQLRSLWVGVYIPSPSKAHTNPQCILA